MEEQAVSPTKKYAESLRLIADFYESHPNMPLPLTEMKVFDIRTREQMANVIRQFGSCEKKYDSTFFRVRKTFGVISLEALDYRENICERVVTGKKFVGEVYIPGTQGRIVPEHEEDIVEWRCDDPVLASESSSSSNDSSDSSEPVPIDAPLAQAIRHDQQIEDAQKQSSSEQEGGQ